MSTNQTGTNGSRENELCPKCLTGNPPGISFCSKCGAPLHPQLGPFESSFAEGEVYRQAAEQPQNLVVVLGMWFIFGLLGLVGMTVLAFSWSAGDRLGIWFGCALIVISGALVWQTTKNYLRRRSGEKKRDSG